MSDTSTELSGLLMAYADGKADPQQAQRARLAIAADPQLADELLAYAATGPAALAPPFDGIRAEPLPERFATLLGTASADAKPVVAGATVIRLATSRVEPQGRRKWLGEYAGNIGLAAAAAAAVFLVGVFLSPLMYPSLRMVPDVAVAEALNSVPSGSERSVPTIAGLVSFKGIETFRDDKGAWCREFEAQGLTGARQYSIACRAGSGWAMKTQIIGSWKPGQKFTPAGGELADSIDQLASLHRAGDPLGPTKESELIAKGWPASQ